MSRVTLSLRAPLKTTVDASALRLDTFAQLTAREIAALPLRDGREAVPVGDVFRVDGERSAEIHVDGSLDLLHGLATGIATTTLFVTGSLGDDAGRQMRGGHIQISGHVGHGAGAGMTGGLLQVGGDAGNRLGAATPGARVGMTGGEIIVRGSAGRDAGMRARRGLILIGGNAGADLARNIIAGTVVVLGRIGTSPGLGSKRGSIVAVGGIDVPATYRLACTLEPPFVRLLLTSLNRRFALAIDPSIVSGRFRRYCGDLVAPGKGEILEWAA